MKIKKNITYIVNVILMILLGMIIGGIIAAIELENISRIKQLLLIITTIISAGISYFIQLIIHEAGHLVFGLLSGYKFVSFRIANIMLVKINNKLQFKKFSLLGTAGQCLMEPPKLKNDEFPVILYNLGGVMMNLISSIIGITITYILKDILILKYSLILFAAIGTYFTLSNGIPLKAEINNDGMNTLMLKKHPETQKSLWIQLMINAALSKDTRIKDMPKNWFYMPKDEEMNNEITPVIGILYCNRLMDEHKFNKAKENIKYIFKYKDKIMEIHKCLLRADQIYCELVEKNIEKANKLLTEKQKRYMNAMKDNISIIRTEYAIAKIIDQDENKCKELIEKFEKAKKTYPYKSEIESEEELIEIIKNI